MTMSTHATPDASTPFLVRSTESGAYFRKPFANMLRFIAVGGFFPSVGLILYSFNLPSAIAGPAAMLGFAMLIAAGLAAEVLFCRARRMDTVSEGARFPVTPALRECARGLAEANYVWSMVLSLFGLIAFLWYAGVRDVAWAMQAVVGALAFALLGWIGLLLVHVGTELSSALVEIANNTQPGVRGSSSDASIASVPTTLPFAPPANSTPSMASGRMLGLAGAGLVLIIGAVTLTSDASDSEGADGIDAGTPISSGSAAPIGQDALGARRTLMGMADQIRLAELAYREESDGFLTVSRGAVQDWELLMRFGELEGQLGACEARDTRTGGYEDLEVRCFYDDQDGDGCTLTVVATKDVEARVLPDTMGCR
jgi:hypothetical protein